jgi:hypothetical protein
MVDERFKQRVDLLDKSGYLATVSNMVMNMCAAFWWWWEVPGEETVLHNGTLCFVNTGTQHIGITCDHVYQEYLADKAQHSNVTCQFGNNRFEPEEHLIDRSPEYDLATFYVPVVFVTARPRHYHHNAFSWPPDPPMAGEVALYGGHPQVLRAPGDGQIEFPFQWFASRIDPDDSTRMVLDPALERLYWPGHEGEPINTNWGGQSGGPVYRFVDASPGGAAIDRLEFVGIIYQKWLDVILARPASLVNADGHILRPS